MVQNRRIVLVSRPATLPSEENFKLETSDIDLTGANLQENEILVKTLFLSLDPYLRASMGLPGDTPRPGAYKISQFKDGDSIVAFGGLFGGRGAGVVVKSKNPNVAEGDLVAADWKWEEYVTFNPDEEITFEKLDKDIFTTENEKGKIPLSTAVGILGVSGSNAYHGYLFLDPKPSDTLVVSSAAGNIGIIASQLGKINGLKTVGLAGGSKASDIEKKHLVDIGIDYRAFNEDVQALSKELKKACPNGIDIYFDNTRGFISEAVYENLNPGARVYVCGGISQYNNGKPLSPYTDLPTKEEIKKIGVAFEIMPQYLAGIPKARTELANWIKEGKLQFFEHVTEGFENLPKAFVGMYKGENFGKAVVRV